ncbi:ImmA/IrrE family metallo-endopeptidase [Bifidobacterium leontopitheci]|nr:ImmA/IrrE family metallo-endopeptidase [Bifidobacterium leontopitheci]
MNDQVRDMLAAAATKDPDFQNSCMSHDLKRRIKWNWSDYATFDYPKSVDDSIFIHHPDAAVDVGLDGDHGPSGLFVQSGKDGRPLILVRSPDDAFLPRVHFTLLHEIGHLLQRGESTLARRLFRLEDDVMRKRFEEDACNRFASRSLLPDDYMESMFENQGVTAQNIRSIYDDDLNRWRSGSINYQRVSRPCIVRRAAEMMDDPGSVTLLNPKGELSIRAFSDGHCEYQPHDGTSGVSTAEREILSLFPKRLDHRELSPMQLDNLQEVKDAIHVSVAGSFSGRTSMHTLIVIRRH